MKILSALLVGCLCLSAQSAVAPLDFAECGVSKGCLLYPEGCGDASCQSAFTFAIDNATAMITLEFYSKIRAPIDQSKPWGRYVAVGFSDDKHMGKDPVLQCTYSMMDNQQNNESLSSKQSLALSKNADTGYSNQFLKMIPSYSETEMSYSDGTQFLCRVKGPIASVRAIDTYTFDAPYYLLLATGPVKDPETGQLGAHEMDEESELFPVMSKQKINVFTNMENNKVEEHHEEEDEDEGEGGDGDDGKSDDDNKTATEGPEDEKTTQGAGGLGAVVWPLVAAWFWH